MMQARIRPVNRILSELREVLTHRLERAEATQISIAQGAGVSQSTVCRVLQGRNSRLSRSVIKLCNYAGIEIETTRISPQGERILWAAFHDVWDGSERDARVLARFVRELGYIKNG